MVKLSFEPTVPKSRCTSLEVQGGSSERDGSSFQNLPLVLLNALTHFSKDLSNLILRSEQLD